jgi:hypothetical protein
VSTLKHHQRNEKKEEIVFGLGNVGASEKHNKTVLRIASTFSSGLTSFPYCPAVCSKQ